MEARVIGRTGYLGLFGDGSLVGIAKMCLSAPPLSKVRLDNGILYALHPSLSLPFPFSPPSSPLTCSFQLVRPSSSHPSNTSLPLRPRSPFIPLYSLFLYPSPSIASRIPLTPILYRSLPTPYILLEPPLSSSYRVSGRVRLFNSSI